jgi:large subunit ribosomal protein L15
MITLNELKISGKKKKKIGRGGSRGGTSGKGHKGQKARSGPSIGIAFEGGQMPLTRRLPKRGFSNVRFRQEVEIVNLDRLSNLFEAGTVINRELLVEKKVIKNNKKALLKILGRGPLDKKFIVHADAFSKAAAEAITHKGGEVHIIKEK